MGIFSWLAMGEKQHPIQVPLRREQSLTQLSLSLHRPRLQNLDNHQQQCLPSVKLNYGSNASLGQMHLSVAQLHQDFA